MTVRKVNGRRAWPRLNYLAVRLCGCRVPLNHVPWICLHECILKRSSGQRELLTSVGCIDEAVLKSGEYLRCYYLQRSLLQPYQSQLALGFYIARVSYIHEFPVRPRYRCNRYDTVFALLMTAYLSPVDYVGTNCLDIWTLVTGKKHSGKPKIALLTGVLVLQKRIARPLHLLDYGE